MHNGLIPLFSLITIGSVFVAPDFWFILLLMTATASVGLRYGMSDQEPKALITILICLYATHFMPTYMAMFETLSQPGEIYMAKMNAQFKTIFMALAAAFEIGVIATNTAIVYKMRSKSRKNV